MSYEPTNWQTGDVITAENLNKIEQGIVNNNGNFFVNINNEGGSILTNTATLNKTWDEINTALSNGKNIILIQDIVYDDYINTNYLPMYYCTNMYSNENGNLYYAILAFNYLEKDTVAFISETSDGILTYTSK